MIDRAIATAAGVGCIVLTGLLLMQTGKLHNAERRADKAELTLSTEREDAATSLAQLTTKARETEQTLTANAAETERVKNAQIADLDSRAGALARRLRDAAATSRLVPATATTAAIEQVAAVCDGARFSGELGVSLVSEAERGEQIRISLLACYKQYEDARKAFSSLSP